MSIENPKVWILLLNWKNAKDTIECLDSIMDCDDSEIAGVVLCDNGSEDGSVEAILEWSEQKNQILNHLVYLSGAFKKVKNSVENIHCRPVYLIENNANLGFAGGNNVGIHFIMQTLDYDFVYLLNNDTLIQDGTISTMIKEFDQQPSIGLCGSKVIYSHTPDKVQALGGASF